MVVPVPTYRYVYRVAKGTGSKRGYRYWWRTGMDVWHILVAAIGVQCGKRHIPVVVQQLS